MSRHTAAVWFGSTLLVPHHVRQEFAAGTTVLDVDLGCLDAPPSILAGAVYSFGPHPRDVMRFESFPSQRRIFREWQ